MGKYWTFGTNSHLAHRLLIIINAHGHLSETIEKKYLSDINCYVETTLWARTNCPIFSRVGFIRVASCFGCGWVCGRGSWPVYCIAGSSSLRVKPGFLDNGILASRAPVTWPLVGMSYCRVVPICLVMARGALLPFRGSFFRKLKYIIFVLRGPIPIHLL